MTKTIVSGAVEMIGVQSVVFAAGLIVALICHGLFGLEAKEAAENVFALQMIAMGWVVRGWYERIEQ